MDQKVAKIITDQSTNLVLHKNYSGRGMFGKTTAAISGQPSELLETLGFIMCMAPQNVRHAVGEELEKGQLRTDQLGKQIIWY